MTQSQILYGQLNIQSLIFFLTVFCYILFLIFQKIKFININIQAQAVTLTVSQAFSVAQDRWIEHKRKKRSLRQEANRQKNGSEVFK